MPHVQHLSFTYTKLIHALFSPILYLYTAVLISHLNSACSTYSLAVPHRNFRTLYLSFTCNPQYLLLYPPHAVPVVYLYTAVPFGTQVVLTLCRNVVPLPLEEMNNHLSVPLQCYISTVQSDLWDFFSVQITCRWVLSR